MRMNILFRIFQLVFPLVLLAMTGCADYEKPYKTPTINNHIIPKNWHEQDAYYKNNQQTQTTQNPVDFSRVAWWEEFNDPTLNQFIERGLAQNNQISVAMANVEAAQGELKNVQWNWVPGLNTNVGYSSFPDLGFPGVLFAVVPSYTLNVFAQIKEQKKAEYALQASEAARDSVKLAVIGQIAKSYFSYSAQVEQEKLLKDVEKDLTQLVAISESMYQGGLTPRMHIAEAKRELNLIEAEERRVQHNIVVSRNALRYLLNENPQAIALTREFSQLNGNTIITGALPLTVIENRPDMIQAANELKASNEKMGLTFSQLLPTVQLSMARGSIGTEPNGDDFGGALNFNQALLQIPVFQGSVYGQIDKAKGLNKASYYRYTDTLRKVMRDVNNDLSAHDLYTQRYMDIQNAEKNAQEVYQLNEALYHQGIDSYQKLLESKVQYDLLAIQTNQSQLEQFITIVNLYQDLAVGYRVDDVLLKNQIIS